MEGRVKMKCFCGTEMVYEISQNSEFFKCPFCSFLKKKNIPSYEVSKQRYDNHVCDEGYYKYMEKIKEKITPYLISGTSLDYGCGKEYALAKLIDNCDYYDLFYYPKLFDKKYNNIILNEVFEHIENPYEELLKIKSLLVTLVYSCSNGFTCISNTPNPT